MIDTLNTARSLAFLIIAGCAALLFSALVLEYAEGLEPCPLCLMQRLWVILVGLLALIGLAHNPRWGIYPMLSGVAAAIGGWFSIRQLYLQGLPEDEVPFCGPNLAYMVENYPFAELLGAMTSGTGDCAKVLWTFLGISIPGWALVGFIGLLGLSLLQLRAAMRPET